MKKLIAIILTVMMAVLSCAALAEDVEEQQAFIDFNIKMDKIPEGYQYETEEHGGSLCATFTNVADETAPIIYVSVAFSDEFEGFTLNADLTEEQLENMQTILSEDYNDPAIEIRETDYGTRLIYITENDAETDYADIITIWNGYFITVAMQKETDLTDDDFELARIIVSDMWIVEQ